LKVNGKNISVTKYNISIKKELIVRFMAFCDEMFENEIHKTEENENISLNIYLRFKLNVENGMNF
jgi:hypothetical protein